MAGLRVLAVDDDITVLNFIKDLCAQCNFHVTTYSEAQLALNFLRERKDPIDVVLCEVYMPDMNVFEFLHHVVQEFNLPIIVMSAEGSSCPAMKCIEELGACDHWTKPLRVENIKNMWQHVARKKLEFEAMNNSVKECSSKRSTNSNEVCEVVESEPPKKKPRLSWTQELHANFVAAVHHIGIARAVPRKILALMKDKHPNLTKDQVASHLQKYRLHLKKLYEESQQQQGISNNNVTRIEKSNIQVSAGSSGQTNPYEATNQSMANLISSNEDQSTIQWPNTTHPSNNIANNFPHHQSIMAEDNAASSTYGLPSHNNMMMMDHMPSRTLHGGNRIVSQNGSFGTSNSHVGYNTSSLPQQNNIANNFSHHQSVMPSYDPSWPTHNDMMMTDQMVSRTSIGGNKNSFVNQNGILGTNNPPQQNYIANNFSHHQSIMPSSYDASFMYGCPPHNDVMMINQTCSITLPGGNRNAAMNHNGSFGINNSHIGYNVSSSSSQQNNSFGVDQIPANFSMHHQFQIPNHVVGGMRQSLQGASPLFETQVPYDSLKNLESDGKDTCIPSSSTSTGVGVDVGNNTMNEALHCPNKGNLV